MDPTPSGPWPLHAEDWICMEPERDRLKHLLIILLEALSTSGEEIVLARSRVQDRITAAGLDEADVNGLLDWIEDQWQASPEDDYTHDPWPDAPSSGSFRHFGDLDREVLTGPALGFLLELLAGGQIDRSQFEAMLQYASFVALEPLERGDLETVIEQVLFRGGRPDVTGGASEGFHRAH